MSVGVADAIKLQRMRCHAAARIGWFQGTHGSRASTSVQEMMSRSLAADNQNGRPVIRHQRNLSHPRPRLFVYVCVLNAARRTRLRLGTEAIADGYSDAAVLLPDASPPARQRPNGDLRPGHLPGRFFVFSPGEFVR